MSERIDFLSPVSGRFLIALFVAAVFVWLAVRVGVGPASRLSKNWPIYFLRCCTILAVLGLLLNPVRVTEQQGAIQPSQMFFVLDASQSMAIGGENATRWDQALSMIQKGCKQAHQSVAAEIGLFRFGRRLRAISSPQELGLKESLAEDGLGVSFMKKLDVGEAEAENQTPANEPDTQLFVALRQISSRFGRKPPAGVVVFSDGRARDAGQADKVASAFKKLGVPVHVAPVGSNDSGGDVALVSLVMPNTARKQSEVHAQAFLRSYGFDGRQVELRLNGLDPSGRRTSRLATVPVTLQSGFQSLPISFRTDAETQVLEAAVSTVPNEVSADNNRIESEIMISREKIRVLYVEGSTEPFTTVNRNGRLVRSGPTTPLRDALQEDVDIECVPVPVGFGRSGLQQGAFPKSVAELSAFDAIILSDVSKRSFSDKQLDWIEGWVRQRGGGLCMVGGRNSFGSGAWQRSHVERMLPVQLGKEVDWRGDLEVSLHPDEQGPVHPLFRLAIDDEQNANYLKGFPGFHGTNAGLLPKPTLARVLAVGNSSGSASEQRRSPLFSTRGILELFSRPQAADSGELPAEFAAITVGQYGKGRTMAMAVPITGNPAQQFLRWGRTESDNGLYSQFWRNAIYWLTEQSYVGRRRLVATADKRFYGPGDKITLSGSAFDEGANETSAYRLVGVIEPQSFDNIESDYSIVRWPNNVPREEENESPFIIWGEEFEIPVKQVSGRELYEIELTLAETLPSGTADQSLRLELTAYEDFTQVDSTSIPIQILHDPFEQQNPFPNHELLNTLAANSGGRILEDESAIAEMLNSLPVVRGPSELSRAPIWSKWWVMASLLGLITTEWCYRRWIGLA